MCGGRKTRMEVDGHKDVLLGLDVESTTTSRPPPNRVEKQSSDTDTIS